MRLGLVGRFTLIGVLVGIVVASTGAWIIESRLNSLMLDELTERAVDVVSQLDDLHLLRPVDFEPPYPAAKIDSIAARLGPVLAPILHDRGTLRVHLFARDGTVLYSDLASKRGKREPVLPGSQLAVALNGHVAKELSPLASPENADLKAAHENALEVYIPIAVDGRVVGAYEIYQDTSATRPIRTLVWGTIGSGMAVLFLALLLVVRAAATLIRRQREEREYQAFHDQLTDLPNRTHFLHRLQHALDRAGRRGRTLAVLFLDLDDFKIVNDSLGHEAGDALLKAVAQRLRDCVRPGDTVARLGGDEFTVLLEDLDEEEAAVEVAERIANQLRAPFQVDCHEVYVQVSVGIAIAHGNAQPPEDLVRDADIAMYEAKGRGKAQCAIFDPAMNARAVARLELESELRRAVELGEFLVYYQPIADMATGQVREVEALIRWQHPVRGVVPPAEFIPLAERTGLIVPIGRWVLFEACRQVRAWQDAHSGGPCLNLSVNLSARQFQHPGLVQEVRDALAASHLSADRLKLEITETTAMVDAEATAATLEQLRAIGVHLAIDDFGKGYSGLSYLKRFKVDTLKIDRSFVDGLGRDGDDEAIVRAVLAVASSLGLSVTAEGVETEQQRAHLQALGCQRAQGYYFSRPLPSDAALEYVVRDAAAKRARLRDDALDELAA